MAAFGYIIGKKGYGSISAHKYEVMDVLKDFFIRKVICERSILKCLNRQPKI